MCMPKFIEKQIISFKCNKKLVTANVSVIFTHKSQLAASAMW